MPSKQIAQVEIEMQDMLTKEPVEAVTELRKQEDFFACLNLIRSNLKALRSDTSSLPSPKKAIYDERNMALNGVMKIIFDVIKGAKETFKKQPLKDNDQHRNAVKVYVQFQIKEKLMKNTNFQHEENRSFFQRLGQKLLNALSSISLVEKSALFGNYGLSLFHTKAQSDLVTIHNNVVENGSPKTSSSQR